MSDFINLAKEYISEVNMCLDIFQKSFGRKDIIKAWRDGVIPQAGLLTGGARYQIHGKGCQVEFIDHDIDFDFIDWEGNFGFDSWKLFMFSSQFPNRYHNLKKQKNIDDEITNSLKENIICPVNHDENVFMFNPEYIIYTL